MMGDAVSNHGLADAGDTRRTSALAVTALVLSCILCCPITTIAGVVVGVLAYFATASGRVSGRWMAVVAIVLGLSATTLWGLGGGWAWNVVIEPVLTGPDAALRAGTGGDISGFQQAFRPSKHCAIPADDAARFCEELTRRYGRFDRAQLDQSSANSRPGSVDENFTADYLLYFERGLIRATTSLELADATGALSLRLISITVHDDLQGELKYPHDDREPTGGAEGERGRNADDGR